MAYDINDLLALFPQQVFPTGGFEPTDQARGINILQDQVGSLFDPKMAALIALLGGGGYDFTQLVPPQEEPEVAFTPLLDAYSQSLDENTVNIVQDIAMGLTPMEITAKLEMSVDPYSDAFKRYSTLIDDLFKEQLDVKAAAAKTKAETKPTAQQQLYMDAGLPDPLRTFTADDFQDTERLQAVAALSDQYNKLLPEARRRESQTIGEQLDRWRQTSPVYEAEQQALAQAEPPKPVPQPDGTYMVGDVSHWMGPDGNLYPYKNQASMPKVEQQTTLAAPSRRTQQPSAAAYQGPSNFGEVIRLATNARRQTQTPEMTKLLTERDYQQKFADAKSEAKARIYNDKGFSPATLALVQRLGALRGTGVF